MEEQTGTAIATAKPAALSISLPPNIQREIESVTRIAKMTPEQAAVVLDCFTADFAPFLEVKAKAEAIEVTDASQTDLISEARIIDKDLLEIDKRLVEIHKAKKEEYLRPGQLVDGIKRTYCNAIADVRGHLKKQFDFVKNQEAEALRLLVAERVKRLVGLDTLIVESEIARMTDDQFELMVEGATARLNARREAERLEAEEKERLRAENERLRLENEEKEREATEQRRLAEFERQERERVESEHRRKEMEAAAERQRIEDERIAREKAEADRVAAEAKAADDARLAEESRIAAVAKAKAAAPDKDKLLEYAAAVSDVAWPVLTTTEAELALRKFTTELAALLITFKSDAAALTAEIEVPF